MNYRFYTLLSICFFFMVSVSNAKIFRVGYTGPQVTGTDYADFQSAHDEADPGDTLLFYPGNTYTGNASKPLVYMGYGYFVSGTDANTGLQLITGNLGLVIHLLAGSEESSFEGIGDNNGYLQLYVDVPINDITVRRCNTVYVYSSISGDCSNWQIIQSYNVVIHPSGNGGTTRLLNLRVENCHLSYFDLRNLPAGSSGQVSNCVINGGVDLTGASIYFLNNVCYGASFTGAAGTLFENNLFDFAEGAYDITGGTDNQFSVDMSNVFVGSTGNSTDGQWQLKAGSPAIGAGAGGTDCGMFGGTNPYRLSGIPSIPVFYKLTAPSRTATTNPYTITFSVKSNN
ncbi:hypothetical protein DC498_06910 [Terrimonas sp.]|uniref:hypothetical protein n=1 Tax=Terrimonas sp. TaxID=1914338 RepID=UPI000D519862|nr:hypothetical protein [Terrimonas sp.]PVD53088.1 hypothetical protein DC498_06910 [Terrimonas sp.]